MTVKCFYCKVQTATCEDHVIPRALRSRLVDTLSPHEYAALMSRLPDTVPACRDCNTRKGTFVGTTVQEIRSHIAEVLEKKHRILLATPDWNESEVQNLGYNLQTYVDGQKAQKELIRARLRNLKRYEMR